jgi:hypothetical protein
MKTKKKTAKPVVRSRAKVTLEDLSPKANVKGGTGGILVGMGDGSVRVADTATESLSINYGKIKH